MGQMARCLKSYPNGAADFNSADIGKAAELLSVGRCAIAWILWSQGRGIQLQIGWGAQGLGTASIYHSRQQCHWFSSEHVFTDSLVSRQGGKRLPQAHSASDLFPSHSGCHVHLLPCQRSELSRCAFRAHNQGPKPNPATSRG